MRLEGSDYIGSVGGFGEIQVHELNEAGTSAERHVLADFEADDHNNPAVLVAVGKPAVVIYTRHNQDALIRYRKGGQNVDTSLAPFGAEQTITAIGAKVTYVEAHQDGDTIHLFTRDDSAYWAYVKSTDWADTWSAPVRVFTNGGTPAKQLYIATRLRGDTMRVALGQAPGYPEDVYYCEINMTTGNITVPGSATVLGNLDGTSLPLDMTSLQKIETRPSGYTTRMLDVADDDSPGVLWAVFDAADEAGTGVYRRAVHDGTNWAMTDVAATGAKFGHDRYIGGAQFHSLDEVVLSSEAGAQIERATFDGSDWATVVVAEARTGRALVRPYPVEGTERIVWMDAERYDDWNDYQSNLDFT